MALVKLKSAGSHPEAQLLKGLLETEGIHIVVQGESRNTDMGTEAGFAAIELLVNEEQLAAAREVLEAQVVADAAQKSGVISEGAVCPVHEAAAIAICSRCGSHLCERCGTLGTPPLCESCDDRLSNAPRPRKKTKLVALVMLALFFGLPTVLGILINALMRGR